MISPAPSFLH